VRAVVLVGGFGTRLRPLTLTIPKQMLPVAEMPMIERVLAHLAAHGVDDAVLSMGYRPDVFLDAWPDGRCAGVRLHYAVEPEPLDTAGAIRFAALDAGIAETFLVVNGDVLTDLDVTALVERHRTTGAEGTIHLIRVDNPSAFGVVPTDGDGRVQAFVEKPPPGEEPTDLINAGTYVLEAPVLDRIPDGRRVSVERETFPAMVADGTLFAQATDDYWVDTGTPAKLLQASLDLVSGVRSGPPAAHATEREPGLWTIGAAVQEAELFPPVLVGDAAYLASGAEVEAAVVGAGCRVESGARVEWSVMLPGAVVESGAVVSHSILGPAAVVGEGSRVENLSVVGEGALVEAGSKLDGERFPATEG
jgi:mannose-1-phosphate guanylyltransferase